MTKAPAGDPSRLRSSVSFAVSACVHSWALAWVILGGSAGPAERPKSIYDQEIRPNEKKIIWYSLRDKLPEISPADASADARAPRALHKAPQIMVAGKKDDAQPAQLIWTPIPEVATPKTEPLPNVVAVAPPPKLIRPFVAPPAAPPPAPAAPVLPDAPKVAAAAVPNTAAPVPGAGAKPQPRAFAPPPDVRLQRQAAILLPEAPVTAMVVEPNALPFSGAGPKPRPRDFVPPAATRPGTAASAALALPAIPEVANMAAPSSGGLGKVPKAFIPPPSRPAPSGQAPGISAETPSVAGTAAVPAETTLAIVGLNPARTTEVPPPPGSRAASFSAGPELRVNGGAGGGSPTMVNVPGLIVKGGPKDAEPTLMAPFSPTSKENLTAAARYARTLPPKPVEEPSAARVTEAPDPRLAGRVVYTVAIQMPNVTSYSGSWLVWFAEHEPVPGAAPPQVKPPVPLRKVDPKYVASAAADRVEGKIRLFGIIRRDGRVDGVTLLLHLDNRLDATAIEALTKWQFEPALRNGKPVEVDAVFEIPFHLAPRAVK
uniref:TonB family protein n=1 Tax=Solibacter usitatus (strain Ellin6076) TaxID=234267 RepID=Q02AZ3_SOLUE